MSLWAQCLLYLWTLTACELLFYGAADPAEFLLLCSTEKQQHLCFEKTWLWVNYDRMMIFGLLAWGVSIVLLMKLQHVSVSIVDLLSWTHPTAVLMISRLCLSSSDHNDALTRLHWVYLTQELLDGSWEEAGFDVLLGERRGYLQICLWRRQRWFCSGLVLFLLKASVWGVWRSARWGRAAERRRSAGRDAAGEQKEWATQFFLKFSFMKA